MVVNDDKGIGLMLTIMLESNGYEVLVSKNTDEAEENIITHSIDLVLLDILIGDVNGIDVCARLRNDKATSQIVKQKPPDLCGFLAS